MLFARMMRREQHCACLRCVQAQIGNDASSFGIARLFIARLFIGQNEWQAAVAALLRENFRRCADADKKKLTASRAFERRQPRNVEHAQNQRDSGARNRPLEDAPDLVVVSDCVGDRGATNHPDEKCAHVIELALRQRHARKLLAIFGGQYRRTRWRNSRFFEQVQVRDPYPRARNSAELSSPAWSKCRARRSVSIRRCRRFDRPGAGPRSTKSRFRTGPGIADGCRGRILRSASSHSRTDGYRARRSGSRWLADAV